MSYILDALKRADAERERGVVPGLYARQLAGSGASTPSSARKLVLIAAGAALLIGAMALLVWLWRPASESAPRVASEQTSAKPAPVPPAVPAPAPIVRPPEVVTTLQSPVLQRAPAPAVATTPATTAPASATPKATASAPPLPAAAPLLAELAEDIRRQIPALTITGAVYSDNPAQRLLLVNNQVLPQGSLAAPEVTLEVIGTKSSTFSFRGNRFRLQH